MKVDELTKPKHQEAWSRLRSGQEADDWWRNKKEKPEQGYRSQNLIKSDQFWRRKVKSSVKTRSQVKSEGGKPAGKEAWTRSSTTKSDRQWRREAWRHGNLNKVKIDRNWRWEDWRHNKVIDQEFRSSLKARSQVKSNGGKPEGKEIWKRLLTTKNDQDRS